MPGVRLFCAIEIHKNGLMGEDKIVFLSDVGRIISNFYFSIVPVATLGLISPVGGLVA